MRPVRVVQILIINCWIKITQRRVKNDKSSYFRSTGNEDRFEKIQTTRFSVLKVVTESKQTLGVIIFGGKLFWRQTL